MSGIPKRCCVFGCSSLALFGVPLHSFPDPDNFPDLFAAWVCAVGEFLKEDNPKKIRKSIRVCDHHFKPEEKIVGGRLFKSAVPSLNLYRIQQSLVTISELDHSYSRQRREYQACTLIASNSAVGTSGSTNQDVNDLPSTSNNLTIIDNSAEIIGKNKEITLKTEERKLRRNITKIKARNNALKQEVRSVKDRISKLTLQKLTENMSEPAKLFTRMQYEEGKKKPRGHRFTLKEKVLALSLFKKSPKAYNLFCKYFTVPSKKVLKCMLSNIKLCPGINKIIFKELKVTVEKMLPQDRLCTLIFDEMSLNPQLHYNCKTDDLVGLKNLGKIKTNQFADHVLVFMVKGIKRNYKQPVAYYFTNALKTYELKEIVLDVIKNVQATGLQIIATVCDQCTINVSVVNSLIRDAKEKYLKDGKEWRKDVIVCNEKEIIPLYDIPHLIKGLRNNLLNKNMEYFHDNKKHSIKWEYIQWVYEADKSHGELRLLHKITREHIDVSKIKKMRVKNAVQVFSLSMAVVTDHLSARGDVPTECRDLIPFILMMDKLFDSLNASSFTMQNGKMYRAAVKRNSPHHELWQDAIEMLKTVKFFKTTNSGITEQTVPSIKNFIKTIEGIKEIWRLLNQKYLIDSMLTRNFNQDPLENFFGSIRSMGARNIAPNCIGFEGAFKTLLLNNYSANHSINANCEEDSNTCLQSLNFFITEKNLNIAENAPSQSEFHDQPLNIEVNQFMNSIENSSISSSGADQRIFVCGWALTKCLSKVIKNCKECRRNVLGDPNSNDYRYIRAKEYTKNKKWLCYPSQSLVTLFENIQDSTIAFLKRNPSEICIKNRIKNFLQNLDFSNVVCDNHRKDFRQLYIDIAINIIIYSWCRSVNRILAGKLTYDGDDKTKKDAQCYYNKHKRK